MISIVVLLFRPLTSGLWIRICNRIDLHLSRWILIRIQKADPDPDPGGQNWQIVQII
jgi:hypothetical protein